MAKKKHTETHDLTEKEAEALLQGIYTCSPRITDDLVRRIDKIAQSPEFGVARRVGLVALSKPGEWFKDVVNMPRDSAEALACGSRSLSVHIQSLKQLTDLLETAEARLMLALCAREDCAELMEVATKEVGTTPDFTPA